MHEALSRAAGLMAEVADAAGVDMFGNPVSESGELLGDAAAADGGGATVAAQVAVVVPVQVGATALAQRKARGPGPALGRPLFAQTVKQAFIVARTCPTGTATENGYYSNGCRWHGL